MMRRPGKTPSRFTVGALLSAAAPQVAATTVTPILGTLSYAEIRRADLNGTGCRWQSTHDHRMRFAMKDDGAIAKPQGALVRLAPMPGSPDAFPFTHDEWTGTNLTISVHRLGNAHKVGDEEIVQPADLTVRRKGGEPRVYAGRLFCGS